MEIISRKAALERGLKYYFTGTPCKHGHVAKRLCGDRGCYECKTTRFTSYVAAHPEWKRAIDVAYYAANRDKMLAKNTAYRKHLRGKLEARAGRPMPDRCEVCGRQPGKRGMHFDHCHIGGHFRGWLCVNCNRALGLVGDNPDLLRKLAEYLEMACHAPIS